MQRRHQKHGLNGAVQKPAVQKTENVWLFQANYSEESAFILN